MRTYDFAPLFRSTIGFDRLFDLAETAQRGAEEGYPPYNIERLAEDRYQITLAVAGFSPDGISLTAEKNGPPPGRRPSTRRRAERQKQRGEVFSIAAPRPATSSASSTSPTTFRS